MTAPTGRGAVVIDTDVYGADLVPGSALAEQYEPLIVGRPAFISFQTAAELRTEPCSAVGATHACSSSKRRIAEAEVVHTGPDLIEVYARLQLAFQRAGHGLSQREHDADRWIAATAIRLGMAEDEP